MPKAQRTRTHTLDELDRRILALLREDARTSLSSLARTLSLSTAAVHERVKRLLELGYLRGFHARLDFARLGLGLAAYVGLQTQQAAELRQRLVDHCAAMPEVEELAWVTGDLDALVRVRARDTVHLQAVVFRILQGAGEGARARTMVVLTEPLWKPGAGFEVAGVGDVAPR